VDPITLIAGATALYNGIKSAVDAGHDMMETADKVGNLFSHIAQIVQLTSAPRKKKLFQSQAEFEADAVKLYSIKAKAKQMQLEVKNLFVGQYGPAAWDAIQREVIEMRKDVARQEAVEQQEKEEIQQAMMMTASVIGGVILMAGLLIVIILIATGSAR